MLLKPNDTIGIVSPCGIASADKNSMVLKGLAEKSFRVKFGENIYNNSYGYSATEKERADDINAMVSDDEIKMIFFGGGEGGSEVLPYLDYENIKKNPKLFLSYSDGTSILNAVYFITGSTVYYGQTPGLFKDMQSYDNDHFLSNFVTGNVRRFKNKSRWYSLNKGVSRGILFGGYLENVVLMIRSDYLKLDRSKKYILFLEDHEKFSTIARVSYLLSHIEQSGIMEHVSGLLFGNYSDHIYPELLFRLERFGKKNRIPVAYCDDFGHGENHGILPIGKRAVLDTVRNVLEFK